MLKGDIPSQTRICDSEALLGRRISCRLGIPRSRNFIQVMHMSKMSATTRGALEMKTTVEVPWMSMCDLVCISQPTSGIMLELQRLKHRLMNEP